MNGLLETFYNAQSQLVTQTADLPLGTLADMVDGGGIDLVPAFQRRERWNTERQSALIESFLLNVPVPPVYLSEEPNGTYTAIDGKQRLRAISDFIHNRLQLRDLERLTEAEGYRFGDLPIEIQNSFRLRPFLRVVTLLRQTHVDLKFEVFLRLNKGGESLNYQEIRNVAYRGYLNDTIYELAANDFLRRHLKIENEKSPAFRKMEDAEYVLRFMSLASKLSEFKGNLTRTMDDFMRDYQYETTEIIDRYRNLFVIAISRCEGFWGDNAFKRPEGNAWRSQLLAGMYDAQMLAASRLDGLVVARLVGKSDLIIDRTRAAFDDTRFEESVKSGTNTPQRIRYRVEKVESILRALADE